MILSKSPRLGGAAVVGTLVLAVVAGSVASAAPSFSLAGEPIDIRADRVEVDLGTNTAVLEGHVELSRKDLRVSSPRVEARFDREGHIAKARATGGVAMVAGPKGIRGEADEVELDVVERVAELRGHVRISQGPSALSADRATVSLATSRVSLEAVRGTFATGSSAPSAALPAPAVSAAPP